MSGASDTPREVVEHNVRDLFNEAQDRLKAARHYIDMAAETCEDLKVYDLVNLGSLIRGMDALTERIETLEEWMAEDRASALLAARDVPSEQHSVKA